MTADEPEIEVLISEEEIAIRVKSLADEIAGTEPEEMLIVVILKGSFVFAADLLRALDRAGVKPRVDFMTLSSYGTETRSSGTVELTRDISEDVAGVHVLIVDDILESGRTVAAAKALLEQRGAKAVKVCMLLDKPGNRKVACEADFVGFAVPDCFVVGYGLDYAHYYRDLPYIGTIDDQ